MAAYRCFPLPVLLCDDSFRVRWGNNPARLHYRHLTGPEGLRNALGEFDEGALHREIRENGSCVLSGVFPLDGMRVSLMPMRGAISGGPDVRDGFVAMLLGPGDLPAPGESLYSGRTAEALMGSVRRSADGIFRAMDAAFLKSIILDAGSWLSPHLNRISIDIYGVLRTAVNVAEYARLQSGELVLKPEVVDITGWLGRVRPVIEELGGELGIPVTVGRPSEAVHAYVDRERMELAFFNLLNNSVGHTRPGNRIEVSLARGDGGIHLAVRDRGRGVAAKDLDRVLRPYVSIPPPGEEPGVGLGLTLAKRLSEMQGGSLRLESAAGAGTTATMILPDNLFTLPLTLGQRDEAVHSGGRFSHLYIGLVGALQKPYRPGRPEAGIKRGLEWKGN